MWNLFERQMFHQKSKSLPGKWKLANDNLGVQTHHCRRNIDVISTGQICWMEPQTAHHAVVKCIKVRALRYHLKDLWGLPPDSKLLYTGSCSREPMQRRYKSKNNFIFAFHVGNVW